MVEAFRKLGCRFEPSQRLDTEQWGIREKYLRLLNRLLTILAEAQILEKTAEGWIVIRDPDCPDAETFRRDLMVCYPCGKAELNLLAHCGPHLANVLLGQTDPLELLFPGGKIACGAGRLRDVAGRSGDEPVACCRPAVRRKSLEKARNRCACLRWVEAPEVRRSTLAAISGRQCRPLTFLPT